MDPDVLFPFVIIGLFAMTIGLAAIRSYNEMVELRQRANQAFADMDAFLKKRRDLIPNLVSTVKGSSAHENQALETVVRLRANALTAPTAAAKLATERDLSGALGKLFALREAYPDLKANANFLDLQERLGVIETEISDARQAFNHSVASYNSERQQLPMVFFASSLGFKPYAFFDVGAEERTSLDAPPNVQF